MTAALPALLPSWGRPSDGAQRRAPWCRVLPHVVLAVTFFGLYAAVSVARYHRMDAASWDLGIFTQAIRGWAGHGVPMVHVKGPNYVLLGDHWSPILALLAPAWWVWPSPVMLLTAQAGLFGWSAGVVSDTAGRFVGRGSGILIGVGYGLSFGLQNAINVEFHEIAFAVPLLAVVGRQLLLRRWHRAVWWALPLLLVKEDLGLTVAVVGVLVWWLGKDRLAGVGTILLGLGGALLEVGYLIPAFNPHGRYDYWHLTPHGAHGLFWWAGWQLTQMVKWHTLLWTFGIVGFLAFRSPLALLALPTLGWRMLSTNGAYWGNWWHYSATLMPIVFLAAVDGAFRLETSRRHQLRTLAHHAPPIIATIGVAVCCAWPLPIAQLADRTTWHADPAGAAVRAATALIPSGSTVESWHPGLASLAARCDVYWIGGDPQPPQYALYVPADGKLDGLAGYESAIHGGAQYRLIYGHAGVALLQRQ